MNLVATLKAFLSLRDAFKKFDLEADDVSDVLNAINVKLFDADEGIAHESE